MSADKFRYEVHLTPRGWIGGSSWFYNHLQEKEPIPRPDDAVETWERDEFQSSSFSAPEIKWSRIWVDSDISDEERGELHKKYPRDLRG